MMSFILDLSGIELKLDIRGYDKNYDKTSDNSWCECDFSFRARPWLDYEIKNDELLLSSEVDELSESLTKLLKGEFCEHCECYEFWCLESDFAFKLYPQKDLREDPKYAYVAPGYEFQDIYLEWCVYLWHDYCTENFITFTLQREDIEKLRDYLISVKKNSLRLR